MIMDEEKGVYLRRRVVEGIDGRREDGEKRRGRKMGGLLSFSTDAIYAKQLGCRQ